MKALHVILIAFTLAGCSPPTISTPGSTIVAPTFIPTVPAPVSTATMFEGQLLFSRFIESTHTFTGMYISRTDGSAEFAVPLPWTEGGGRWSRSGKQIAVATLLADGRVGTAIIAIDGTVLRVLSISDATLNLPCMGWSSDDTRIACEGWDETDPSRSGVYTVLAVDGGDIQRLTTPPAGQQDVPGDYSSVGQFIFMRSSGYEVPGTLMIVDANGGEPRILYDGRVDEAGRFSPDGRSVVTAANGSLLVIGLDGNVLHRIGLEGQVAFGPVWSPDGTRIAFSLSDQSYRAEIYTSLPDGTDLQQVTHTSENEISVDWGVVSD